MEKIVTTLTTEAIFSEDGSKRYLLRKTWDTTKPKLTIVMMAPSIASGISIDATTQLTLNNCDRLGYGSVSIVNLFATLNDFSLKQGEDEDPENMDAIVQQAQDADLIVFAPGVGKAKNKLFQTRQEQVLTALLPFEAKLHCLCDENGEARLQHPLSPAVRTWNLSPLKVSELISLPQTEQEPKKKAKGKQPKDAEAK